MDMRYVYVYSSDKTIQASRERPGMLSLNRRGVRSRREVIRGLSLLGVAGPLAGSAVGQLVTGLSKVAPAAGQMKSELELRSSDTQLVDTFNWARSQAMAYAFDDHDPVGPWYEAVEPGREGFSYICSG